MHIIIHKKTLSVFLSSILPAIDGEEVTAWTWLSGICFGPIEQVAVNMFQTYRKYYLNTLVSEPCKWTGGSNILSDHIFLSI